MVVNHKLDCPKLQLCTVLLDHPKLRLWTVILDRQKYSLPSIFNFLNILLLKLCFFLPPSYLLELPLD